MRVPLQVHLVFNYGVGTFRYKAFISYSHRDRQWSAWLQRALEGYRVPKRLVGSQGEFGPVPRRLTPVFLDREELSSGSDLSSQVKECLDASEALVVVCSPAAAQSIWVNEEIRYFRSTGRENQVFALIVDGEPQSQNPDEQCFPPALTEDADGTSREPLAADARKWADGKLLAKLKIISGILGIRLDELRRRDMQRRHRLWMASAGTAMVIALVMTALAVIAITARNAAENRREHAEELVGYMVGDLKTKLDEVGRLDILEGMGSQVSEYLETLNPEELTDESLTQQAQVWRQLGEVSKDQGDLAKAQSAFSASRDILAELHRRNPENAEYLYELGNADFWLGYVQLDAGEFDNAEKAFNMYLEHANRLVEMEPDNPKWLMEKSYALSNLAALVVERSSTDTESALANIKAAVELNKEVIRMVPEESAYRAELSTALAWLADTQLKVCDLGGALISRQESLAIAQKQSDESPANVNFRKGYAFALTGVASVASQVGLTETAVESYRQAKEILGQLSIMEPSNLDTRFSYLMREAWLAVVLAQSGHLQEALTQMAMIREPMIQVLETESYGNLKRNLEWVRFLLSWSDMEWRAGMQDDAGALLSEAIENLERLLARDNEPSPYIKEISNARFLYWQQRGEDLFQTPAFSGMEVEPDAEDTGCQAQAGLVTQAILEGDLQKAQKLTTELLAKGYYEPGFILTCRQYHLCE
jgi:tetratricopeptide (TPR) repeat protein